jgi:hypothetical protein
MEKNTREKIANFKIDFIGIGAPRCATTWITECLDEHPQICVSRPKETNYFIDPKYKKKENWYKSCFQHCLKGQIKGEFSTHYIFHPEVIERIKKYNPEVKIIACLRNPVERTISHYLFNKSFGGVCSFLPLKEAVLKEKSLVNGSLYYTNLKDFFKHFPRKNILILIYEDIERNPLAFIRKIYEFLNVNKEFIPSNLYKKINPSTEKKVKVYSLNRLISLTNWYMTEKNSFLRFVYRFLKTVKLLKVAHFIRRINRLSINNKKYFRESKLPPVNSEDRKYLRELFAEDIKSLEKLIGRDLSFWKQTY